MSSKSAASAAASKAPFFRPASLAYPAVSQSCPENRNRSLWSTHSSSRIFTKPEQDGVLLILQGPGRRVHGSLWGNLPENHREIHRSPSIRTWSSPEREFL